MKLIYSLAALLFSFSVGATGFQAGTFHCSINEKVVTTWTISAPNREGLPLVDYTAPGSNDVVSIHGLATVGETANGTLVGISALRGSTAAIFFSNDGTKVFAGIAECVRVL